MSVNPGFGGQKFIPNTISKVKRLRQMIARRNSGAMIEIDGGVDLTTAPALIAAGADVLVAGSFVFKAPDPIGATPSPSSADRITHAGMPGATPVKETNQSP